MEPLFIIARTASHRPTLMHVLVNLEKTACGLDVSAWSRAYLEKPVLQIMCLKCKAKL